MNSTTHYICYLCKRCPLCASVYKYLAMESIHLGSSKQDSLSLSATIKRKVNELPGLMSVSEVVLGVLSKLLGSRVRVIISSSPA